MNIIILSILYMICAIIYPILFFNGLYNKSINRELFISLSLIPLTFALIIEIVLNHKITIVILIIVLIMTILTLQNKKSN